MSAPVLTLPAFTLKVAILKFPFLLLSTYSWIFPSSPLPSQELSVVTLVKVKLLPKVILAPTADTSSLVFALTLHVVSSFGFNFVLSQLKLTLPVSALTLIGINILQITPIKKIFFFG